MAIDAGASERALSPAVDPAALPALISQGTAPPLQPEVPAPAASVPAVGLASGPGLVETVDEATRTVARPDGSREVEVAAGPVRFRGSDGGWVAIDVTPRWDGDRVTPAATPVAVSAPVRADGALVLDVGDGIVSMRLVGAGPSEARPSRVDADVVEYAGALGGRDVQARFLPRGFEVDVVLADASQPAGYDVEVALPHGWSIKAIGAGVVFVDATGGEAVLFGSATATDAGGALGAVRVDPVGANRVRVTVDEEWLAAPERVFPVVVDPTTVLNTATSGSDSFVVQSAPAVSGWSSSFLQMGHSYRPYNPEGYYQAAYGLLRWDLSSLPTDSFVLSATMRLRNLPYGDLCDAPREFDVRALAAAFTASTTWANQPGVDAGAPAGVFDWPTCSAAWFDAGLPAGMVQRWVDGTAPNHGVRLSADGVPSDGARRAQSGETAYPPQLTVVTTRRPSQATPVFPDDDGVVSTDGVTLRVDPATDPDGDALEYLVSVTTGGDGASGEVVTPDALWSATTAFTIPASRLRDGQAYHWQVHVREAAHPAVVTPADWVRSFTVRRRLGSSGPSPMDDVGPVSVNVATGNVTYDHASWALGALGGVGVGFGYDSQRAVPAGLKAEFFFDQNANRVLDDALWSTRTDTVLNFAWGLGAPVPTLPGDGWMARWAGFVTVPYAGAWKFCYQSSGRPGTKVWVNGTLVVNTWWPGSGLNPVCGSSVSLAHGQTVPITVEAIDAYATGTSVSLALRAQSVGSGGDPSFANAPVPASWLTRSLPVLPAGWAMEGAATASVQARIASDSVVVAFGSRTRTFTAHTGGGWQGVAGDTGTFTKNTDGTYTLVEADGSVLTFDGSGRVTTARGPAETASGLVATVAYDTIGRPASLTDPVSGRQVTFTYQGGACPAPPSGFDSAPPSGMLCKVTYWDANATSVFYVGGQVGRIVDPGSATTDFAYSSGRLWKVRTPLAADAVAAGVRIDDDTARTVVTYDASGRAAGVTLPAPIVGAARPAHTYEYVAAPGWDTGGEGGGGSPGPTNGEARVHVAGLTEAPAFPWARKVTYDHAARPVTEVDGTGATVTRAWLPDDRLASVADPAGITTTYGYEPATNLRTDTWGPAPAACFTNGTPNGSCTNPAVPHRSSAYDTALEGLSALYWANTTLAGPPAVRAFANGPLNASWGTGAPAGLGVTDNWSARYTGWLVFPTAGDYGISVTADNKARVYLDGTLVADGWASGSASGTFTAPAPGIRARLLVEYQDLTGSASLALRWDPPTSGLSVIPSSQLRPGYGLVTSTTVDDTTAGSPPTATATGYANPANGQPTATTVDPGGLALATTTTYDTTGAGHWGRALTTTLPAGNTWTNAYWGDAQAADNPCTVPVEAVNQAGLPRSRTGPLDSSGGRIVDETVYDTTGRPVASQRNSVGWVCTTYDTRGRVATTSFPAGGGYPARTVTRTYAVAGNPLVSSISDPAGTITTTLDLLGRPVASTDVWGVTSTTTFDQAGRATTSTGPAGELATTYDQAGRALTLSRNGATLAAVTYDATGRPTTVAYPSGAGNAGNGTGLSVGRDTLGRVNSLTWAGPGGTIATDTVTFSQSGRWADEAVDGTDANPAGPNFTYDAAGRLTGAVVAGHTLTYGFAETTGCPADTAGRNTNRTSTTDNAVTTTACYDAADRLTSTTDAAYNPVAYDSAGNTTTLGATTHSFDTANRHLGATAPGSSVTMTRDALDRVVTRTTNATTYRYAYSGPTDAAVAVLDTNNTVIDAVIPLPGGATVTIQATGQVWSYPNVHGDTLATADANGTKAGATYHYDPYGNPLTTLPDNLTGPTDHAWLARYARDTQHPDSQPAWIDMGARAYSPALGRFLQVDPIVGGSDSDYEYGAGEPNTNLDISGESLCKHRCLKNYAAGIAMCLAQFYGCLRYGRLGHQLCHSVLVICNRTVRITYYACLAHCNQTCAA